ncbi:class I SAM-dependent methyltransferase [Sorangium sp. So ce145]|uniref:class I SAM-dependent methyltransferase n=1 Tax=Sorangium sp. So ce145 TaxID=3133285 RepID=UPI003F627E42
MEKDARRWGGAGGRFDLALATNVLHATRSIPRTLRNAKALLKENGWLVLNEVTR